MQLSLDDFKHRMDEVFDSVRVGHCDVIDAAYVLGREWEKVVLHDDFMSWPDSCQMVRDECLNRLRRWFSVCLINA